MKFRDSDKVVVGQQEAALCTLRSQLLMSLHDISASELCTQVWLLTLPSGFSLISAHTTGQA